MVLHTYGRDPYAKYINGNQGAIGIMLFSTTMEFDEHTQSISPMVRLMMINCHVTLIFEKNAPCQSPLATPLVSNNDGKI